MGDGTGSAPPGPDRTATPALPPGGGRLFSASSGPHTTPHTRAALRIPGWQPCAARGPAGWQHV